MIKLKGYTLKHTNTPIDLAIPKRARVIAVTGGVGGVMIHTQCLHDDDTAAFDVKNARTFIALEDGDVVPDGSGYVGTGRSGPKAPAVHVYELSKVRPVGL
jgi:sugar lactone lactonase YvrE